MKVSSLFLLYIFLSILVIGQEVPTEDEKKTSFIFQFAVTYKTFISSDINDPTTYKNGHQFLNHRYAEFKKEPTFGFGTGILFDINLNNHWNISTGLLYYLRREIFECDIETAYKYKNDSPYRDIYNAYSYDYLRNNLDFEVLTYYRMSRFAIAVGCNLTVLSYNRATYEYVMNGDNNLGEIPTSAKTVRSFSTPWYVMPTIQFCYDTQIKTFTIRPYIALYYVLNNQDDLYIKLGVNIPLKK